MTLYDLLKDALVKCEGSQARLAKAINVSPSRMSRLLKESEKEEGMELGPSLRLAKLLERPPAEILRFTKHAGDLPIIEELFGPSRAPVISAQEKACLALFRLLQAPQQQAILALLRSYGAEQEAAPRRPEIKRRA